MGKPQRLTEGSESAWMPVAAAGRIAFVSSRPDANLWSVSLDPATGLAPGAPRRLTRGAGILNFLSLTSDARTLAYFSVRLGQGDIFLRDVRTGTETPLRDGPPGQKSYPAISPNGSQLAFGTLKSEGDRALRPILVQSRSDGSWRQLGEDSGGRPREWVDEVRLIIQRFARPNSLAIIDTHTGDALELIQSEHRSVTNSRLSPDRRWIAFDAASPGEATTVFVAPFDGQAVPESKWIAVDRSASHPFWSADGRVLYYTPIGSNPLVRQAIRGRRISATGVPDGEPFAVYSSSEVLMPAYLAGTGPIATPDEIFMVLGDFRGDVWMLDLAE